MANRGTTRDSDLIRIRPAVPEATRVETVELFESARFHGNVGSKGRGNKSCIDAQTGVTPTQTQKRVVGGDAVDDENDFLAGHVAKMVKNSSSGADEFFGVADFAMRRERMNVRKVLLANMGQRMVRYEAELTEMKKNTAALCNEVHGYAALVSSESDWVEVLEQKIVANLERLRVAVDGQVMEKSDKEFKRRVGNEDKITIQTCASLQT